MASIKMPTDMICRNMRAVVAFVACGAATALPGVARANPSVPTLGSDSVFIPFANATPNGGALPSVPEIRAGFNGGAQVTFTMDTGSTGIVVSPDNYTMPNGAVPIGPGSITYTSSGIVLNGQYYTSQVNIGTGGHSATAQVPVLVVDSITCLVNARACTATNSPTHVAMFGVGFGQEAAGQPDGTPDKNAFLHITQIAGQPASPTAGYVITPAGVTLGLTAADTQGMNFAGLTWNSSVGDWNRAPVTVTVGGATGQGTVLNDTGVSYMYLQPPLGSNVPTIPAADAVGNCVNFGPCAAPGTTVSIAIGDTSSPAASYAFTVGANGIPDPGNPASPDWVTVLHDSADVFVNTSYHFFNAFNYMYDYTDGLVGYSPIPEPPALSLLAAGCVGIGFLHFARRRRSDPAVCS